MKTAILCIGDELLDGRVRDENAYFLTGLAAQSARNIEEIRVIADDLAVILKTLEELRRFDEVVVTGGLGPTADDITRDAAAEFAGVGLVEEQELLRALKARFAARGAPFTANNRRQCSFPRGAQILPSQVGTAAGFSLQVESTTYYFFPGVPAEFRWFVAQYLPRVGQDDTNQMKRMIFFGLGESQVETLLRDAAARAKQQGVRIGYRAQRALIEVNLKGANPALQTIQGQVLERLGPWLVAEDDESFMERLARRLIEASATVAVAESCTAGLVGARLTDLSGSSRYFHEGYLTYSNDAKERLLGVSRRALEAHGAVSPEVATQMALGAKERSAATYALAISGIAGPTGGTDTKPVGTVDFALAAPEGVYYLRRHVPGRTRKHVRTLSTHTALALLLWRLEDRLLEHPLSGPFSEDAVKAGTLEY